MFLLPTMATAVIVNILLFQRVQRSGGQRSAFAHPTTTTYYLLDSNSIAVFILAHYHLDCKQGLLYPQMDQLEYHLTK